MGFRVLTEDLEKSSPAAFAGGHTDKNDHFTTFLFDHGGNASPPHCSSHPDSSSHSMFITFQSLLDFFEERAHLIPDQIPDLPDNFYRFAFGVRNLPLDDMFCRDGRASLFTTHRDNIIHLS